ncbi:drebrin-like protein B [Aspergillus udagawae]|uniref:Drebrin-like protein B, partial n=1 Tax=Aspergillus udagawae TaxID=91492 RepID=A0A8H3SHK5_9EURO|nr:drebrin-like protein B [Aspergillus udagawae]
MASLNLSSNGPSITKSYRSVIDCSLPTGSATYGQWAVFSVSTPLVNAFQKNSDSKESVLKVQDTGAGELEDLIDEFSEGKIQFAFVKVTDPNTGLPKNVLIGWCGEGVPERTKGYFTSHLSAVSKFLPNYHVQITARSEGDLTPEGIIQKVGDASGAKYTPERASPVTAVPKTPSVASKPAFTPTRTGAVDSKTASNVSTRVVPRMSGDDNGWGPDAPPVTRTELEKVQSAYKPTKVDIEAIKSQNQPRTSHYHELPVTENNDVVKGGYQPIGKVDISAIRKQAREAGEFKEDRPEPVRGAYEPVGKVDIAAIRSKAQKQPESSVGQSVSSNPVESHNERIKSLDSPRLADQPERLTTLPKPKVANKIGLSATFTGTKAPLPGSFVSSPVPPATQIGIASRTFADEGGKTPAQQWAERKAREQGQGPAPSPPAATSGQGSNKGEWKSSYNGKTWAPVQTTPTGNSVDRGVSQQGQELTTGLETSLPGQPDFTSQDQKSRGAGMSPPPDEEPVGISDSENGLPAPYNSHGIKPEEPLDIEAPQPIPSPPQQPRSPTPPTPLPVRESSPIRVAVPVGRGEVADAHDEQYSPPPVMPTQSLRQAVPDDEGLEDTAIDIGRETSKATVVDRPQDEALQAIVQYDYEKAEDNEIDLKEGEYVSGIEMVDKDWWLGSNARGERGLFPSNYVELVKENKLEHLAPVVGAEEAQQVSPIVPAQSPGGRKDIAQPVAVALYDYEAAEDNELSFPEGVQIVNIEFPDDDWWFGEYNGQKGLFPANYVQLEE